MRLTFGVFAIHALTPWHVAVGSRSLILCLVRSWCSSIPLGSSVFCSRLSQRLFAVAGWIVALRGLKRGRFLEKITVAFVVVVVVGLLSGGVSVYTGRYRLGEFLDSISPHCAVSIAGRAAPNPAEILDALRSIADLPAHHSSPGRTFDVVISDPPRQLTLWVARDSSDPREYWVFFPSPSKLAFRAALKTDIGHVKTTVFDGYGL